jgi:hypothetical protein
VALTAAILPPWRISFVLVIIVSSANSATAARGKARGGGNGTDGGHRFRRDRHGLPGSRTHAAVFARKKHRNASNRKGSRPKHQRVCAEAPVHKVEKNRKVNSRNREIAGKPIENNSLELF